MEKRQKQQGWWYPYIFVGGFGVVLAVNLILLFFATSTFNGLETANAYEKGLAYNEEIAAAEAQAALGWTGILEAEGRLPDTPGLEERPTKVRFTVSGPEGRPVDGLGVSAVIRRPTVAGFDQTVTLSPVGPGTYGADVVLPMAGQWEVRLKATRGDDIYRLRERIFVR